MKAVRMEPGKGPERIEIENSLEALQAEVGGYIETVTLGDGWTVLCDEEGRLKGKPFNYWVKGVSLCGTILFVGTEGEEFCDVPERIAALLCPDGEAV